MIFILNRVDQRGSDDKPLDVRLQHLKKEIQEQLNLPSLKVINVDFCRYQKISYNQI